MDYDAEYFEKMLRQEERGKRQTRDDDRGHKRHSSKQRSRDERQDQICSFIREISNKYFILNDRDRARDKDDRQRRNRRSEEKDRNRDRNYDGRQQKRYNDYNDRRDNRRQNIQKDPYYRDRRQIQRMRQQDPKKADQMQQQLQKKIIIDKKQKQVEIMTQKFKKAQKQLQEAKRQDLTVLVYCLPLRAKQDDIWMFFKKQQCGKVRDIQIIKDPKSFRSKGVAYVEFYLSESVQKALRTDGRQFEFGGRKSALKVQHSQAQKNRAAAAARDMRIPKQVETPQQSNQNMRKQMKVKVGGLIGKLAHIQQRQLKDLFQSFGNIQKIDINRDPLTGRCRGFAFIQYSRVEDANSAVKIMHGKQLKGERLEVSTVNVSQQNQQMQNAPFYQSQNFNRPRPTGNNLHRPPMATETTNIIVIYNMFTMQGKNPGFFEGLKKEFLEKCSSYGKVQNIFLERNDQGNIWVKFSTVDQARKAIQQLQKIFFDGNKVKCYSVTQNTYNSRIKN